MQYNGIPYEWPDLQELGFSSVNAGLPSLRSTTVLVATSTSGDTQKSGTKMFQAQDQVRKWKKSLIIIIKIACRCQTTPRLGNMPHGKPGLSWRTKKVYWKKPTRYRQRRDGADGSGGSDWSSPGGRRWSFFCQHLLSVEQIIQTMVANVV